nr:MAG TPA: hypothetical protein [Caudoviricetes sp.]DAT31295.1 MAG TPA: hypothetical protein [Caudoviricetes sp.]
MPRKKLVHIPLWRAVAIASQRRAVWGSIKATGTHFCTNF